MDIKQIRQIPPLGPRGEGWVVIQAILFLVVVTTGVIGTRWPDSLRGLARVIAIFAGVLGLWFPSSAALTLGKSVSPFPKPPTNSELKESGVYTLVRHPIYGGLVMLATALSLWFSPWAFIPTGVLSVALAFKSRLEEQLLLERHPSYARCRERVRRRFVPYLW